MSKTTWYESRKDGQIWKITEEPLDTNNAKEKDAYIAWQAAGGARPKRRTHGKKAQEVPKAAVS